MSDPRVYGVDPSLTATGVCCSRGWATTLGTTGRKGAPWRDRVDRVATLARRIRLAVVAADLVVVEIPPPGQRSHGSDVLDRAALLFTLAADWQSRRVPVAYVHPVHLKQYATGNARAGKRQMGDMARWAMPDTLELANDNEVDAAWLCDVGCRWLGRPMARPHPHTTERQASVLERVEWPGPLELEQLRAAWGTTLA